MSDGQIYFSYVISIVAYAVGTVLYIWYIRKMLREECEPKK
jgi:hypothetical protein